MLWNSVKEFMPGKNAGKILIYFGSSNNMLLCTYSKEESFIFDDGYIFTKYDCKGNITKFVDFPTHWAIVNEPEI